MVLAGIGTSPGLRSMAAGSPPPNVLFIVTDQQRWDTMSIAGNPVLFTPHLDRRANKGACKQNGMTTTQQEIA